jgi:hypothetical protein
MKYLKGIGIGLCLAVLCLLAAPRSTADDQSIKTAVTFTVPVEVPGVSAQILPAGTYRFMVLESTPDRDIIQISSADGSHVFTTMLGVPNSHLKAPDLITVMFTNRPAANPLALMAWYCPGRIWGDQIVYEKPRATQLAKETNEPVLSTSVVQAMSSEAVLKTALIEAVGPGGETVALAQVVDVPPAVTPAPNAAMAPATAAATNPTGVSTVAAGPAIAVAPVTAPAPTIAIEPTVAATPASAIDPPATSVTPATTDPAAASAPTPIGEPAVTPAPAVSAEPVVAVAPVAPVEPAVTASHELATATIPKTASLLPLIGLVGLLMLGAGFLMTSLMKRRA